MPRSFRTAFVADGCSQWFENRWERSRVPVLIFAIFWLAKSLFGKRRFVIVDLFKSTAKRYRLIGWTGLSLVTSLRHHQVWGRLRPNNFFDSFRIWSIIESLSPKGYIGAFIRDIQFFLPCWWFASKEPLLFIDVLSFVVFSSFQMSKNVLWDFLHFLHFRDLQFTAI